MDVNYFSIKKGREKKKKRKPKTMSSYPWGM